MHIPTHQIHNVLNAYAKRLKKIHDAANNVAAESNENQINAYSVEEKRRVIINKISADIIDRIARSKPAPRRISPKTAFNGATPHPGQDSNDPQAELLRYNYLTKDGKKISTTVKILDSDFLIKQLEEIARNSAKT